MKIAIKVLVVLLAVLIVATGVAWYMLGHGGQPQGTPVPVADITPARHLLSDLKANSSLKFSMAVPRSFDWYVASSEGNPTRLTLSGVAMIAKSATSDEAVNIDAWLRQQGFAGDTENNSFGDTTVSEGYTKDSLVILVVTPVTSDGTTTEATQLVVYAGVLPGTPAVN
ncbi:MAG: hypothetical protein NTZ77_07845 [Caldiserica bacterium]|nr:hypothetical protein [Caldisericota bacterium]